MYEYGVPERDHLALPSGLNLEMQFPLAVASIGDFAAECVALALGARSLRPTSADEVIFSARVLQAFDESRLRRDLSAQLCVLSAAAYYLADSPGSAMVQIRKIARTEFAFDPFSSAVAALLSPEWAESARRPRNKLVEPLLSLVAEHTANGATSAAWRDNISSIQNWVYDSGSPHELLMADVLCALAIMRLERSAWTLLPKYSALAVEQWSPYLRRKGAVKEIWESQRLVGDAGIYSGSSGVIQMPTSAGKSRAIELIIRSSFLSERTRSAVVVAPFRALCQELAGVLESAFLLDAYDVNQVSDAIQLDYRDDVFDPIVESNPRILVLTPEKFLYMIRQDASFLGDVGLIVFDEAHQFEAGIRGVTFELLLTSIKTLLPSEAQRVLISAVLGNAQAIARWFLEDETRVVSGLATKASRLIGFASLPPGKDGQIQFNAASFSDQKFFVPRVIVREEQKRYARESKIRVFPSEDSGSVALYLALRLVTNGGVAIFSGTKRSAIKIVRDASQEVFNRGISLDPPSTSSDPEEIKRFVELYKAVFGEDCYLTKSAQLGIFAHHGGTPHGVRLAIEHAMRERKILLVVCTSTLAQGVNLPIRYLLVTSAMQGREQVRPRDFHNLMGRVGRAGMYGEGTVIFTNHKLYDERRNAIARWESALALIEPATLEPVGTALLSLLRPLTNELGTATLSEFSSADLIVSIVKDWTALMIRMEQLPSSIAARGFTAKSLKEQLEAKRNVVTAIESFLMTHRSETEAELFVEDAKSLARETLAYSLVNAESRDLMERIFAAVAENLVLRVPDVGTQRRFGKTLMGVRSSVLIDEWVRSRIARLEQIEAEEGLFEELWPLLLDLTSERIFIDQSPNDSMKVLAYGWLSGRSYAHLLDSLDFIGATYAYGESRRKFDIDLVVEVCEQNLSFEFCLYLAAIREACIAHASADLVERTAKLVDSLQRRLKYGLPNSSSASFFEAGFADRVIAQELDQALKVDRAKSKRDVRRVASAYRTDVQAVLSKYPSHFSQNLTILLGTSPAEH